MNENHPKPRTRRFLQFSLRALLVFVLLVSVGMSWFAVRKQRVRRQREAVKAIEKLGGQVRHEEAGPPLLPWLRELLGDDFFFLDVDAVYLSDTDVTDAELGDFKWLTDLEGLDLHGTPVTDTGLGHLKGLTSLEGLGLHGTTVSDAGLAHLEGLTMLELLVLSGTQVTDAGLEHLVALKKLRYLSLEETHVTLEGVKKLQEALPDCEIVY